MNNSLKTRSWLPLSHRRSQHYNDFHYTKIHNYCPSNFSVVTSPLSLNYINFRKNTNLLRNQQEAIRRWKRNKYKKQNRMNSGQVSSSLSKQCKIDNLLRVRPMKYSNIKTVNTELQLSGTSFFSRAR